MANDPQNQPGVWQGGPSQWIGGQLYGINPASGQWEPLNTDTSEQSAGVYTFGGGNPVTQGQDPTLFDKIAMTGIQLGAGAGLGYGAYGALAGGGAAAAGGGGAGAVGADTAGAAGGAGTDAFAGGAGGTGLSAGSTGASGIGAGAGTTGVTGGTASGALGTGYFGSETAYPVIGGESGAAAGAGAGSAGYGAAAGAGGGTALSRILSGNGTSQDYLSVGGNLAPALLGAYAANRQTGALQSIAGQYANYGAPSRGRYEASMTPGFDPNSIPGYSGAVDTASKSLLARLSATGGNPYGNPGGLIDANKQIISGTALPAIQAYQNQNANVGFGGTLNAAGSFGGQAIGAQGNVYNAVGAGINDVTNPPQTLAQQLQTLRQAGLYSPNSLS